MSAAVLYDQLDQGCREADVFQNGTTVVAGVAISVEPEGLQVRVDLHEPRDGFPITSGPRIVRMPKLNVYGS